MLKPYNEYFPEIDPSAWIAGEAIVIGRVFCSKYSSIWYNCVVRADINMVRIGESSNIQDGAVIHVGDDFPVIIGDYVTIGHGARLHGCTIADRALIGIGAIILNGATVGEDAIIGAGCLVPEGQTLAGKKLYLGIPAKPVRDLSTEEIEQNIYWAKKYVQVAESYKSSDESKRKEARM